MWTSLSLYSVATDARDQLQFICYPSPESPWRDTMQQTNKETSVIAVTENQVADPGNLHAAQAPGGAGILARFIIAGVIGAALSWVAINRFDNYFQLPQELASQIGISDELQASVLEVVGELYLVAVLAFFHQ